jgi:hypothetical protein
MLLIDEINLLFSHQMQDWQMVRENYAALDNLLTRELWLRDSEGKPCSRIILQHNPARVRSTAADLRPEAIKARPCFLCDINQPSQQQAVLWKSNERKVWYKIQVNPYPIFKRHLTVSLVEHKPQLCYRTDMMELAKLIPEHVIMFNGVGCGASAPDHMHFQATYRSELPLCQELASRTDIGLDSCYGDHNLWMDNAFGRQLIYIRTGLINSAIVSDMFIALYSWRRNALCWFEDDIWHFVIFPRTHDRPSCYGEDEGQYLVSPAAAEYGGVWVLPRKEDFERLDSPTISSFFKELSCNDDDMSSLYYNYARVN